MKHINQYLIMLISFLVFTSTLQAGPVGLRIPDTTATEKDTISIPVIVDTTITDSNVVAYQLDITYNNDYLNFLDIISTGTMCEAWNDIEFSTSEEGRITIAAAGSTPLAGKGELVLLRFYIKRSGTTYLYFDPDESNILNEGSPEVILSDGRLKISSLPIVRVTPDSELLTSGEKRQFNVSGGTAPYSWSVTVDSVASINSSGLLTADKRGFTRVVAEDSEGIKDTTNGEIEVRAFKLSFRDTSGWQGSSMSIPVYVSDVSTLNIFSGEINISYNENILEPLGYSSNGTMLEGYGNIEFYVDPNGTFTFSFAGTSPLTGGGILIYIDFAIHDENTGYTYIEVEEGLFNENILSTTQSGRFDVIPLPDLDISPAINMMRVGETRQFTVSNGTPPYAWETSDPSVAMIDADGLLTAVGGGVFQINVTDDHGATGSSDNIVAYSTELNIPDTSIRLNEPCVLPVYLDELPLDEGIVAFEINLEYDTTWLSFNDITTASTLTDGWSIAYNDKEGELSIAAAGVDSIHQGGRLIYLHFTFRNQTSIGRVVDIDFTKASLNEGFPLTLINNGSVTVLSVEGIDLSLQSIDFPESACELSEEEEVIMTVINTGTVTISSGEDIPVGLVFNDGEPIEESYTLNNNFQPGYSLIVEFTETFDMSVPGDYTLMAYTAFEEDVFAGNDTLKKTVSVFGKPAVDLGPDTIVTSQFPVLLDAGAGFVTYEWQDGSTGQTYSAANYGWYRVTVTDDHGCINSDSIYISPEMDIGVTEIFEPVSSCELSENEYVRVTVKNFGTSTLNTGDRFTIALVIDDQEPMVETHEMIGDIDQGETFPHRFAPQLDFSGIGDYRLVAYTDMDIDGNRANDTTRTTVTVFGYPEVDLGPETIETTEFPVTLDAGPGFAAYEWQDGSSNQTYNARSEGWYWVTVTDDNGCSATDSVFIEEVVGIFPGETGREIYIYPNPARNVCRIIFRGNRDLNNLEIIDLVGKLVYSRRLDQTQARELELDLSVLDPGVYFLRLNLSGKLETLKMIVE